MKRGKKNGETEKREKGGKKREKYKEIESESKTVYVRKG